MDVQGAPLGSVLQAFAVHHVRGVPWVSTGLAVRLAVSCCANELGPCHFEQPRRILKALEIVGAAVAEAIILARHEVAHGVSDENLPAVGLAHDAGGLDHGGAVEVIVRDEDRGATARL